MIAGFPGRTRDASAGRIAGAGLPAFHPGGVSAAGNGREMREKARTDRGKYGYAVCSAGNDC
jgi:hypothetical protein